MDTLKKAKGEKVILVTTGGTFEKVYDESTGVLSNQGHPLEGQILPRLRYPHIEVEISALMAKDSANLNDQDREKIQNKIQELAILGGPPLVVIHGTDTMDQTLNYCIGKLADPPVAVVFTGAMRPWGLQNSDALQNLAEAIVTARLSPPGYYLAFHGERYDGGHFKKDINLKTFIRLQS